MPKMKLEITYHASRYDSSERGENSGKSPGTSRKYKAIRFPSAARLGDCLTFSVSKFGAAEEAATFRVATIKDIAHECRA